MTDEPKLESSGGGTTPEESVGTGSATRDPIFPPWSDHLVKLLGMGGAFSGLYIAFLATFGLSPYMIATGYMPEQDVPYNHALHVGELGIDCRYCHSTVEHAAFAAIPPTQTCMNCHDKIHKESELLAPVRESYATGEAVEWTKVHDLPGYVYFDHSAHVTRGVSCVSCHGRVDRMEEVFQQEPLSMGWCLDCHRNPAEHLRPVRVSEVEALVSQGLLEAPQSKTGLNPMQTLLEDARVTNLGWGAEISRSDRKKIGRVLMTERGLLNEEGEPNVRFELLTSCSTCHR